MIYNQKKVFSLARAKLEIAKKFVIGKIEGQNQVLKKSRALQIHP